MEVGDSGDELGDVSMMMGESKVELVVVGDESVDSEAADMLSRGKKDSGSGDASDGYRVVVVGAADDVVAVVVPPGISLPFLS